jgi:sec-independent protein translocase protein TatA
MFRLGPAELVLILLIVFFLFGAKRLPEMGKGIGEAIKGFKSSIKDDDSKK